MQIFNLLSFCLAGLVLGDSLSDQANQPCAKGVHIIAARGNGTDQGYGIMLPMVVALKDAIPHSTNISVSYPKGVPSSDGNTPGTQHQKQLIKEYARQCPKTPIVLVGYSEGAGLTMNTVCGTSNPGFERTAPLDRDFRDNVLAVVVYGDYTRASGQSYDMGGCESDSQWPRGEPSGCDPIASKIQSYCNAGDPVCCSTGQVKRQHYTYFKKYDARMSQWVRRRFNQHKNKRRN